MNRLQYFRSQGLGDTQTHNLIASGVSGGITATAILYAALAADPEPLTKAALAIAAIAVQIFHSAFSGCGTTCVQATKIVDQLEPYLKQNVQNVLSGKTSPAQGLQVFDAIAQDVQSGCSDPNLGDAGKRCISERLVRGGTAPWCPNPGNTGCDWYTLYRLPIEQAAASSSINAGSVIQTITSDVSSLVSGNILIPIILALGGAFLVFGDRK